MKAFRLRNLLVATPVALALAAAVLIAALGTASSAEIEKVAPHVTMNIPF